MPLLSRALAQPENIWFKISKQNDKTDRLMQSQDPVAVDSKSRNKELSHEKIISL